MEIFRCTFKNKSSLQQRSGPSDKLRGIYQLGNKKSGITSAVFYYPPFFIYLRMLEIVIRLGLIFLRSFSTLCSAINMTTATIKKSSYGSATSAMIKLAIIRAMLKDKSMSCLFSFSSFSFFSMRNLSS